MQLTKAPDISHLSSDDIVMITEKSTVAQAKAKRDFLEYVLKQTGTLRELDPRVLDRVNDLIAATKEQGDCGGGIVCGC